MIKARAALHVGEVPAVIDGEVKLVFSPRGFCVCITCGKVMPWNSKGCHAGHFMPGLRDAVRFYARGINPQCYSCNEMHSGKRAEYELWMSRASPNHVDVIKELHYRGEKKWSREELDDMRARYRAELREITEQIRNAT